MPTLKRNVSEAPDTTGFESYSGPNPPNQARMYRGTIEFARIREASTGTIGINLLVKFAAAKGDKENAKYNGYPAWVSIWLADKEPNLVREKAFYRACGVPEDQLDDVKVIHDDLDDGGAIKKVGGRNPLSRVVMVDMKTERNGDDIQLRGDAIFPVKKQDATADDEDEADEADDEPDADEVDLDDASEEEPDEYDARQSELEELSIPKLRKEAKALEIDPKGMDKEGLVEAILEAEFPPDEEADETEADEETAEPELPDHDEIKKKRMPQLRKWAMDNGGYEDDDLDGLKKDEIMEMLMEDELVTNPEPPF